MKKLFSVGQITLIAFMSGFLGMFHALAQNYKNMGNEVQASRFRKYGYLGLAISLLVFTLFPDAARYNLIFFVVMAFVCYMATRSLQGDALSKHLSNSLLFNKASWGNAFVDGIVYGIITVILGFGIGLLYEVVKVSLGS